MSMNEDRMRQIECETYLDNAICEKSQEDRIKELEEAVSFLAIDLASFAVDQREIEYDVLFQSKEVRSAIESISLLKGTLMEILK